MSFSDNDNWMDELDFFPNLKPDFECSGLGLFPTDDEINMLQTSDIFGNQEQMKFDNEQEMNYVDSFFNDQSTNRTIETNTNNIDMVQPKQPPNQVIKTLLLKSTKKDLDPPLQNGLIYQNIEEQGSNKVQFQSNIITDHSFMQDNINIINTNLLNTPNNATSNNQQINVISSSNNALNTPKISIPNPTGKSNNNVIVISPTSVASQLTTGNSNNVNNNNNKKIHKIILNPNPVNLKLHNQPIVLTSPLNQYNIDWTTFDQVNQSALNNSVSVSNILNTQALTQSSLSTNKVVSNGVKVASLNNNNDNTNNDNVNVSNNNNNIHGVIINNINNINNANNLNSNNNIDNNLNKNITFNIGCSNNSNLCLGGDKEAEPIRTSHNSIEKRYRMSINNRIVELRELLAGKDSKLSKSAVLRKAIEYIRYMVAQNKQLKQENLAFRLAANSNKDFQSVLAAIQGAQLSTESIPSPSFSSPSNSPHSDDSPPSNSPTLFGPSDQAILPQRQHPGMLDRSRLILCIFMFAIFAFNPLGLIFNMLPASDTSASETPALIHSSSRMLQSEEDPLDTGKGWDGWLMPVLPWLFNLLLLVAIVMKLFVLGEPLTKPLSPSSLAYWRRRNEAEQQLFKKCYVEAGSHLGGCLVTLGRPLPTTKFDLVASLLWNLARQALHRLRVGMWLEGLSAVCCKGVSKKDVQSSAKDAAVIYHKLLQLHMTDHLNQGTYGGVNILLSTLNMAEVAGEALPKETLAEIYTLVAMDIRMALPGVFHFLARYFLTQARGICFSNCNSMPPSLTWLNHPLGHRFFVDATWIIGLDKSIFTTCINEVDPLAHMLQNFRESLLEKATLALVTPGYRRRSNQAVQCQNEWISNHSGDTLRFLGLLNEVSSGFNSMTVIGYCQLNHLSNNIGVDSLSKWWFTLLSVAVHWLNEDFMAAEALYASVESLPSALFACNSQLVRAVLLAFKARKHQLVTSAMSSQSDEDSEEREKEEEAGRCGARRSHRLLCNKASELLRDNIDTNSQQTKKMILGVQLLALDWLLVARTEAWQRESCEGSSEGEGSDENLQSGCSIHPAMPSDLCHFQTDLASLRKLSAFIKAAMPKVFAHQATARLMAGASPYRNMHLYTRSLRKRHNTKNLYLKPSRNHHHHHHNSLEELDGEKEGWKEEEWKNGKRKEAKKEEGRDLKNYILCKKVPDEEEVEQLPVPPRNTPCKRDL